MKKKRFVILTALLLAFALLPQGTLAADGVKFTQRPVIAATTVGVSSVKVSWNKVSGAAGYEVYKALPDKGFRKIKTIKSGRTVQYTDKGLKAHTSYYYRVRAYKMVGGKRVVGRYSWSEQGTAGIPEPLKRFSAYNASTDGIFLGWNYSENFDGVLLYRSSKRNGTYKQIAKLKMTEDDGMEYLDEMVEAGKAYYYKARPYITYKGAAIKGKFTKVSAKRAMHDNPEADMTITQSGDKELIFRVTMKDLGYDAEFFIKDTEDSFLGKIELYQMWKNGTAEERRQTLLKITGLSSDGKAYKTDGSMKIKAGETIYLKATAGEAVSLGKTEKLDYNIYCHYKGEYDCLDTMDE